MRLTANSCDATPDRVSRVGAGRVRPRHTRRFRRAGGGMRYYGYRYLAAELGRWVSRDIIAENGGANIYALCVNSAIRWYDSIGLTAELCEILADKIERRVRTGIPELDRIIDLAKEYKCDSWKVTCKCCGPNGVAGKARAGIFGGCVSTICYDNNQTGRDLVGTVVHEMQHCLQFCRGIPHTTCRGCLCAELQAYNTEDPSLPDTEIVRRAKASCSVGTFFGRCWSEQQQNEILSAPGFVRTCRERGNIRLLSHSPLLADPTGPSCSAGTCQ
jgi:RHS repeat-associated protein